MYSLSPKDRKSLTIIETIYAKGYNDIPLFIIVQGKYYILEQYHNSLKQGEKVVTSEKGFTNDEIALQWLDHFIEFSKAGPNKEYKLLLLDNGRGHRTPEFVLKAEASNIIVLSFPAYLTHILQPLDVVVFRVYKHYYSKAIDLAIEKLKFEYSIVQFFCDLYDIRAKTLPIETMKSAFKKSGIQPARFEVIEKNMARFVRKSDNLEITQQQPKQSEPKLPLLPRTPKTLRQVQDRIDVLAPKMRNLLSSPSQRQLDTLRRRAKEVILKAEVVRTEKELLFTRISEMARKLSSCTRLQKGRVMTGFQA